MQRYVFYAPLSFASLFLNAAACRGRGRGRGLSFLRPFYRYFLLHRKGNAQILSYFLEGRNNEST